MAVPPTTEFIRIVWTHDDVQSIAEENDISFELALERVNEWSKYIRDTANTLIAEQLASVITTEQP